MKSTTIKQTLINPNCITAAATILGDKWTPSLIRSLSNGALRFGQLQDAAGGVNPRTLSSRLDDLEGAGIIQKVSFAEVPPRVEYSLTQKGEDLLPILHGMAVWSEKYKPATHHF